MREIVIAAAFAAGGFALAATTLSSSDDDAVGLSAPESPRLAAAPQLREVEPLAPRTSPTMEAPQEPATEVSCAPPCEGLERWPTTQEDRQKVVLECLDHKANGRPYDEWRFRVVSQEWLVNKKLEKVLSADNPKPADCFSLSTQSVASIMDVVGTSVAPGAPSAAIEVGPDRAHFTCGGYGYSPTRDQFPEFFELRDLTGSATKQGVSANVLAAVHARAIEALDSLASAHN